MDYFIHDSISAGFNKIIFIIREDIDDDFRECIGNRVEASMHHSMWILPMYVSRIFFHIGRYTVTNDRTKPWRIGQIIFAVKVLIYDLFTVINVGDHYRREAFCKLYDCLVLG